MSIIVTNIRSDYKADSNEVIYKALKALDIKKSDTLYSGIFRESLDLRHGRVSKISSVEIVLQSVADEMKILETNPSVYVKPEAKMPSVLGNKKISSSPVVIGFGPAGMFSALILAEQGFKPVVFERGSCMEKRDISVDNFFKTGQLNSRCNIQFGEGGAGAYSDGKLTTRINDPLCQLVLDIFKKHGAPDNVLRLAKPHIGTDVLKNIVVSIRKRIEELGGSVIFDTEVTGFETKNGKLKSVVTNKCTVDTEVAVIAIGHSARDTVFMLANKGLDLIPKAFSVGMRIEHLQSWVNESVYGRFASNNDLPAAEYTLSAKPFDRGCYSFCMCPGGYVIAAASEEGGVVTNGMSLHARNGINANSAVCVSVTPEDFESSSPLSGIEFQRKLERSAFNAGGRNYYAPVQTLGDFIDGMKGSKPEIVKPSYPVGHNLVDFNEILPHFVSTTLKSSMPLFAKKLSCFGYKTAVFTGVETRTSSPVRICRDDSFNSTSIKGFMPCGEGAGYAGGIMSAAVDGIKVAAAIMNEYFC